MTTKKDRVQFEESAYWDLIDKFVDKNTELWNKFVDEEYQLYEENFNEIRELEVEDYLLEQWREKDEDESN